MQQIRHSQFLHREREEQELQQVDLIMLRHGILSSVISQNNPKVEYKLASLADLRLSFNLCKERELFHLL